MRVTLNGHKLNIILETIGVTIHWDGNKMVSIEATAGIFNRTAGLCGTMDQNGGNDFMSKDGKLHTVSGFGICDNFYTFNLNPIFNIQDTGNIRGFMACANFRCGSSQMC